MKLALAGLWLGTDKTGGGGGVDPINAMVSAFLTRVLADGGLPSGTTTLVCLETTLTDLNNIS